MKTKRVVKRFKTVTSTPAATSNAESGALNLLNRKEEIAERAKRLIQLSALRLSISKQEEEEKSAIDALMKKHEIDYLSSPQTLDGHKITIEVEMKSSTSTSIDIEKLTDMLTDEQFKQCASVTLKAAKEVLPVGLVNQCCTVTETSPRAKVSASKGFPVPTVTLFE